MTPIYVVALLFFFFLKCLLSFSSLRVGTSNVGHGFDCRFYDCYNARRLNTGSMTNDC